MLCGKEIYVLCMESKHPKLHGEEGDHSHLLPFPTLPESPESSSCRLLAKEAQKQPGFGPGPADLAKSPALGFSGLMGSSGHLCVLVPGHKLVSVSTGLLTPCVLQGITRQCRRKRGKSELGQPVSYRHNITYLMLISIFNSQLLCH